MTKTILPLDETGQAELERHADALLKAAGDEEFAEWPDSWPEQVETEFERIAAAHTGMVPCTGFPSWRVFPHSILS
ncbi:hypothetical protein ACH4VT_31795 [Streptomyces lydicus]|uniref:hypothetical protein n=1 Tax=Streptomyces lydicus TaxID=47763 RepID=UPI0037A44014